LTLLAVVLTGLAMSLLAASPAAAEPVEFFGISQAGRLDAQDLQGMSAIKVRTERFLLRWGSIEQTQGSLDWSNTDASVGALASHGIRPVPYVWGSPRWISSTYPRPPLDSAAEEQAWQDFLKAAASRYGPGGTFWASGGPYQQAHPGATPLPIKAWQIWNEPNLSKYFAPSPSAQKYARLVKLAHDAIRSRNPQAQIVLAGMVGSAQLKAYTFLDNLYGVTGFKASFDIAALHPYGSDLAKTQDAIERFHGVLAQRGDGGKPLWITELSYGSDPPDQFGVNKGLAGQERLLRLTFKTILSNRSAWNVKRIFWFFWRDPETHPPNTCSFCGSAGLLRFDRTKKPAYNTFKGFTATPPVATITSGPSGPTNDSTPTFAFSSDKVGSVFQCHFDAQAFAPCSSPFTPASPLSDGAHTFRVKAIDANGNESQVRSRSFTVDTVAPAPPQITATAPASPANNNSPKVKGSAAAGTTVKLYKTAGCTGSAVANGSPAQFASPGITATVPDNSTTAFRATATDAAGNASGCSSAQNYVEDSTPPQTTITSGPSGTTSDTTPTFTFSSSQSGSSFRCRFDSQPFAPCSGPGASHTPSSPLSLGSHTFQVRAIDKALNADPTAANRSFTII
jgi:hypothetical protein